MGISSIDQGTTISRAILFGEDGSILKTCQMEFNKYIQNQVGLNIIQKRFGNNKIIYKIYIIQILQKIQN